MSEPAAKRARLEEVPVVSANDAVRFRLLKPGRTSLPATVQSEQLIFFPEYTHQIFGEEEEIRGYTDLVISIWLCPTSYNALVEVSYSAQHAEADDIMGKLTEAFPAGFSTKRAEFLDSLAKTPPLDLEQLGTRLGSLNKLPSLYSKNPYGERVEVYQTELCQAPAIIKASPW